MKIDVTDKHIAPTGKYPQGLNDFLEKMYHESRGDMWEIVRVVGDGWGVRRRTWRDRGPHIDGRVDRAPELEEKGLLTMALAVDIENLRVVSSRRAHNIHCRRQRISNRSQLRRVALHPRHAAD